MGSGFLERSDIGDRIGSRHLELHHARVGQTDVPRRLIRGATHHALEHTTRTKNLIALERLQRGATVEKRSMRRQQLVERLV
jgi:hypothetical protein